MRVELWDVADVKPYENNPRRNDRAVEAVARSIAEFGFRQPIVVDEGGVIVVGDTRYKAALRLGLTRVPVHVAAELTPAQVKAYRIADNKTAALAEWDDGRLVQELADLQKMDFDVDLLGFSAEELGRLLGAAGRCGPDRPRRRARAARRSRSRVRATCWLLGKHRLLCGDSGKPEDVDRLLDGAAVHLVNTDPPYNVRVEPRSNNAIAAGLSSFAGYGNSDPGRDVARRPEKAAADDQEAAGKGPAAGQRLRPRRGLRPAAARLVRQPGARAAAGPGLLRLGRLRQLRQLPARAEGRGPVLLAGDHLGQGAPRADPQRLHGQSRMVLLRLARGRRPPVLRAEQRHRRLVDQEGQPPKHDSPDREARRAGGPRDGILLEAR